MAEEKRKNLGRGLSALLGEAGLAPARMDSAAPAPAPSYPGRAMPVLPVSALTPSRYQPRRQFDEEALAELAESLKTKGVLQPILVRIHPSEPGLYEIIAGERRWRAAQRAQLHEIPVLIRELSDQEAAEIALVENLQRRDLSPLEEAEGYRRLLEEFKHTQEELARAVGKSRSHLANILRLLALPDSVKALLESGKLSAGHARALLTANQPEDLAREVVEKGLSVRQTEALASASGKTSGASKAKGASSGAGAGRDPDLVSLERDLTQSLGLKVSLKSTGSGGELTLYYGSLEQLDDILSRLSGETSP